MVLEQSPSDLEGDPSGLSDRPMIRLLGQERSSRLADTMMYTTIVRISLHGDDRHCILFNSLIEDGELCVASCEQNLVIPGGD